MLRYCRQGALGRLYLTGQTGGHLVQSNVICNPIGYNCVQVNIDLAFAPTQFKYDVDVLLLSLAKCTYIL